jgi:hypothetical protein
MFISQHAVHAVYDGNIMKLYDTAGKLSRKFMPCMAYGCSFSPFGLTVNLLSVTLNLNQNNFVERLQSTVFPIE